MRDVSQHILPVSSATILIICAIAAFIDLNSSSFWADEIFTAYFAEPVQTSPGAVILRSSEDVHPPGYYLMVWIAARLTTLDIETASRGFSALMAVVSLGVLLWAPLPPVSWAARLSAAAFAATSILWFDYSQEARSYAFCFVLVAGLIGLALRCQHRLQQGEVPFGGLAGLTVLAVLTCLSHYYVLLLSGALFSMLLVFCKSWRAAVVVALAGLVVLASTVAYLGWHMPRMAADIGDTWFSADAAFISKQITMGLGVVLEGRWSKLFLVLLAALLLLTALRQGVRGFAATLKDPLWWRPVVFLGGVVLLSVCYGIAATIFVTPMLSFRLFILLAPVGWVALAYVLDVVVRDRASWAAPLLLSAGLLAAAGIVLERGRDDGQAWRASAQAVAGMEGCLSTTQPVMWWDQPYFGADDPSYFYGFYLPPEQDLTWIKIPRDDAAAMLSSLPVREVVRATANGTRRCKLVLWSVHMHGRMPVEEMQARLQAHLPAGSRHRIAVEIFQPPGAEYWNHARLFTVVPDDAAAD